MPRKNQPYDEDLFKDTTMTFGEHLEELRSCLWKAVVGLVIGFIIGLYWGDDVVELIQVPLVKALRTYYQEQSTKEVAAKISEFRRAGYPLPEDPDEAEAFVENYAAGKRFEEVYINPGEMLRQLEGADTKQSNNTPRSANGSASKDGGDKLVRVFIWRKIDEKVRVTSLSAHEPFMIYIKASLLLGVLLASPWIFYQIWTFVAAGLYPHEQRYIHVFLPFSLGLFILGAATAFVFVFPPVLKFLFLFNEQLGIAQDIRISEWLGFVLMLPLGFGISFQLPLVMLFLERIGIFDVEAYLSKWRIAILVIFVLAMFLTPADPTSMILMAVPLTILYFGGILLCKYMPRSRSPFDSDLDQPDKTSAAEKPKRRRFPFGLRALIAVILLAVLVFGWLPWKRARQQRTAVEEIQKLGGRVHYGFQLDESGQPVEGARPPGPSVLRKWLGDDFFADVVRVDLSGSRVTDAGLEHLEGLSGLQEVDLRGTEVTGQAVKELREALPNCKILDGPR